MRKHLSKAHSIFRHMAHTIYSRAHKKLLANKMMTVLLFLAIFGTVGAFILEQGTIRPLHTAELSFAELSPKGVAGGKIFPASCALSYSHFPEDCTPPPLPACSYLGELISDATPSESRGARSGHKYFVSKFGEPYYCFGNQGGPDYYIPIGTVAEMQAFWSVLPNLPGLFRIKACFVENNCIGVEEILACAYAAPDDSGITTNPAVLATAAYGPWSNPQCGTSGTGWHASISSCGTSVGTGFAKCKWVLVRTKSGIFTSSSDRGHTYVVPAGVTSVEYLVVAGGGGGGGGWFGGGGGAGGMQTGTLSVTPGASLTVTVGAGGVGGAAAGGAGGSGGESQFGPIKSIGGGGGGGNGTAGVAGGSGGGGAESRAGGSGNAGQGFAGGNGGGAGSDGAGGGGGASAAGGNRAGGVSGSGGAGRVSSITGAPVTFAGGGGGGANTGTPGTGGSGGGGSGRAGGAGLDGIINTGGGGGGAGGNGGASNGGAGGSGIVIVIPN